MIQKSILLQNSLDIQRFLNCSRFGLGVGVLVGALHGDSRFRESEELFLGVERVGGYARANRPPCQQDSFQANYERNPMLLGDGPYCRYE